MSDDDEVLACPLCGAGWEKTHKMGYEACDDCAAAWTFGWGRLDELVDPPTE